jgi:hypothetical protein
MSYDLGVWYPHERLSDTDAGKLYVALCEGTVEYPRPNPAVDAFYQELTAKHPEIDTVADDRIDDYCPWSRALDHSSGHVIMPCGPRQSTWIGLSESWLASMDWPSSTHRPLRFSIQIDDDAS